MLRMITYAPRDDLKAIKQRRQKLAIQSQQKKARSVLVLSVALVFICASAFTYLLHFKQLPSATTYATIPQTQTQQPNVTWPVIGSAAIGTDTGGVLATNGDQTPTPTASVTKVITALLVLQKHPLKTGESGPNIPITQADVDSYNSYVSQDGSSVPVAVGQQLSEYQALQALLLPSANNIADTLAIWAYGSLDNYHQAANQYTKRLGMNQTTVGGDASGFKSSTVSTPRDLVLLGQAALKVPVMKEIVNQKTADLPVAGTVKNVNALLGQSGIIGIKTGNTTEAGGCFLFAAENEVAGKKVTLVGAVMKAPSLEAALADTPSLIASSMENFETINVTKKGAAVGTYKTAWGSTAELVATQNVSVFGWKAAKPQTALTITDTKSLGSTANIGELTAKTTLDSSSSPIQLNHTIAPPSLSWRFQNLR